MKGGEIDMDKKKLTAYVDGSYCKKTRSYSYGCVYILPDGSVETESGHGNNEKLAVHRNVAGEILGAMAAVTKALDDRYDELELFYDYTGIEGWGTGRWKTNVQVTQNYAEFMRKAQKELTVIFTKVNAHTGVEYNEMADTLSKNALGIA